MGRKNPYHRIIFTLLLVGFSALLNAQSDSIAYSSKFKFSKKEFTRSVVTFVCNCKFKIDKPSEVQFSIYNKQTLALLNEFGWSKIGKDYINHEIKIADYFDGQILLLSTSISADKKTRFLWLTSLAPNGIELKHLKLKETANNTKNSTLTFELFKNPQDSHVGVSMVLECEREFFLDVFLLDLSLAIIKEKEILLGNIKKVNYPHSFLLSDNGFLFFLNGLSEKKNANHSKVGLENRLYQLYIQLHNDKIKQYNPVLNKFVGQGENPSRPIYHWVLQ